MKVDIYVEGGARDKRDLKVQCQKGFHKLFDKMGFSRNPAVIPCGNRGATFKRFKSALQNNRNDTFVVMLVDSEDPVQDIEKPWAHLRARKEDRWIKPEGASDDQIFLMTTCMETWIVADRESIAKYYGSRFSLNALPPKENLESHHRHELKDKLEKATKDCTNRFKKGERSFEVLAIVTPAALRSLPSFARMERILKEKLR